MSLRCRTSSAPSTATLLPAASLSRPSSPAVTISPSRETHTHTHTHTHTAGVRYSHTASHTRLPCSQVTVTAFLASHVTSPTSMSISTGVCVFVCVCVCVYVCVCPRETQRE